jgi:hypothetical protein
MPFDINPATLIGVLLFFTGGAYCIVTYLRASRLGMGFTAWRNAGGYFAAPVNKSVKRNFALALAAAACGGLLTCSGLMAGDQKRNSRCEAACETSGFPNGRFRGNPHVPFKPGDPYGCWCQQGNDWSAEPVAF